MESTESVNEHVNEVEEPEETVDEARKLLKRDLLMCEGYSLPITEADVASLQVKNETPREEAKATSNDFISYLREQDEIHQKNLHFIKQYDHTLSSKAIYTGVPESKQLKVMQTLSQKSQFSQVFSTITNHLKPGSLDDGGRKILELNLEDVYYDLRADSRTAVLKHELRQLSKPFDSAEMFERIEFLSKIEKVVGFHLNFEL